MAEKILQTRIINKHTSYDIAINNETFTPKAGEIVLAKLDVQQHDGQTIPTFLMKVGDGEKSLKELNWLHAPASDVYSWAKQPTLAYDALPQALRDEIDALQAAVGGEGSVAQAIADAINALDVTESKDTDETNGGAIISAISETDGKISVTRRALTDADIAGLNVAMAKVTGLDDALALKADASDVKDTTDAITARLDTGDIKQAIDGAKTAGDNAQAYAEGIYKDDGETKTGVLAQYMTSNDAAVADVRGIAEAARTETEVDGQIDAKLNPVIERVAAIESDYTTAEEATAIADDQIAAFKTATVDPIDGRLTTVEGKVNALSSATHFLGVKEKLQDVANPVAGDIVIVGNKEYVYDTTEGWVELGDTTAELAAIDALEDAVDAINTSLATGGDTANAIEAAQDAADAAQEYAEGVNEALEAEVDRATKAEAAIIGTDADTADDASIVGAKKYAAAQAAAAESAAKADTKDKVDALTITVNTNAQTAADATKEVADDLAAEILRADAAEKAAAALGQQGIDDAAAALAYAKSVETNKVDKNTEAIDANAANISTIEKNFAKVKATEADGKTTYSLVVGEDEDVIIFDCGSVE